jgi:predicted kinase
MKPFVLIIYGPVCAGKSVTAKYLMDKLPSLFRVSIDKVKFLISDFTTAKYPLLPNQMVLDLATRALEAGLSLVVEGNRTIQKELWKNYEILAQKYGARFVEVNIEANPDTLVERFKDRVVQAKAKEKKLSFTTIEAMVERNEDYFKMKKPDLLTLSSDELTVEERGERILALLKA